MKSLLLSHKRNPEDKLEKTLDKKNAEENANKEKNEEEKEKDKEKDINKEPNNETGLPLDENKEKENKEETHNEKKSKKRIKKSLKRNNNKTKDEKQENENKEKDENNNKQKPTNKRIGDYFLFSGKKEQNNNNTSEENKELNNAENNINNTEENLAKELMPKDPMKEITNCINKEEIFSLDNNNNIKYDTSYINEIKDIPDKIKDFYILKPNNITNDTKAEYISTLKNYFTELKTLNNTNTTNSDINAKKNKLIFIHNSFAPLKKIPTRESNLINPRNYLAKDEYLIDYEKDSEDEYMEENAEDIKSNDNEDKEEDEEDDINSIQDDKFIVPDGHLSEEELSDKDMMKERQLLENSKENLLGIMSILNIRRNFQKPIVVDFRNKKADDKVNYLMDQLTIGLFKYEDENVNNENINTTNMEENNNNNIYEENEIKPNKVALSFPIVIGSKVTKYKGIEDSIKIHFEDILRKVHGSYDTKEHLILQLNKKFEDISKKSLNTFFKEKCLKIQKKYWMVNNDTLSQFNIKEEELEQIKKENFNIYKEKEEKRKKELEEIKIKDGIIQPPSNTNEEIKDENNDESHISHNNSNIAGDKNDKEGNENNDNDNNIKNKSRSKNSELKPKFKSKTKSRKRNDINNEGYKMKQIEVLFKESEEARKNIKVENNITEEQNKDAQIKKKETLKIFNTIKMTEEERQKDLLEIPVINYKEDNEDNKEMKEAEEENKKPKRKRKENKEKIKKAKSKEPTRNKSKSKSKSNNKKERKKRSQSKKKDKDKTEMMEEIKEEKEENEEKEKNDEIEKDKEEKNISVEKEKESKEEKNEKDKKEKSKRRRAKSLENKIQKKTKSKKTVEEKQEDKDIDKDKKEEKSKKKEKKQKKDPKEEKVKKQKEKKEKNETKSNAEEKSFTKSKSQVPFKFTVKNKPKEIVQHNQSTIDAFINNKQ